MSYFGIQLDFFVISDYFWKFYKIFSGIENFLQNTYCIYGSVTLWLEICFYASDLKNWMSQCKPAGLPMIYSTLNIITIITDALF